MTLGTVKGLGDEIRLKEGKELFSGTSERLVERVRREQEITQELASESVNAYAGFVGSLFSYYRASVSTSVGGARGAETKKQEDGTPRE